MALINKLNDIGDAIRQKTGGTEKLTLEQMVTEIAAIETGGSEPAVIEALVVTENGIYTPGEGIDGFSPVTVEVPTGGGGDLPEEAFVITGDCSYRFANSGWDWFINNYGKRITTKNISKINNMFSQSTGIREIPFEINIANGTIANSVSNLFNNCRALITAPKINNLKVSESSGIFQYCYMLREIPSDFCENWDWSYLEGLTSAYSGNRGSAFNRCHSLRSFPMEFLNHTNPNITSASYTIYGSAFTYCYVLDEIVGLPVFYTLNSNAFNSVFTYCMRLKNMTFATQADGTPYTANWKSQIIDLSMLQNGVAYDEKDILNYNSGITADKRVTDDESYQALKNDPDWYTLSIVYSRYNHNSAVATINSLPDTSAYLASTGGTNTLKLKGVAGSGTDGGAINTLTEEEIAVAAAKGWTVTLA